MNAFGKACSIYFISAILICHFMLLNLFLAILLENINTNIDFERKEKQLQKELKEQK